jgi:hypothetical protein
MQHAREKRLSACEYRVTVGIAGAKTGLAKPRPTKYTEG